MQLFRQVNRSLMSATSRNASVHGIRAHGVRLFSSIESLRLPSYNSLQHKFIPHIASKARTYLYSTQSSDTTSDNEAIVPRKSWRPAPHRNPDEPVYELYFTCNACQERSGHTVSKQGYHHGTVLVQCPNCQNRHLISDHLKIFSDKAITLEDIMEEQGELVRRGTIGSDGDVEFWDGKAAEAAEIDAMQPKS